MPKRHNTRRAPHMERYAQIHKVARGKYSVVLRVDHQSFAFPLLATNKPEATWMLHMLCIALDRMVMHEFDRRDFLEQLK